MKTDSRGDTEERESEAVTEYDFAMNLPKDTWWVVTAQKRRK